MNRTSKVKLHDLIKRLQDCSFDLDLIAEEWGDDDLRWALQELDDCIANIKDVIRDELAEPEPNMEDPLSQDNTAAEFDWKQYYATIKLKNIDVAKNQEVRIVDPETGGEKGKKDVRLHAAPWESLAELGRVFAFGEDKYDDYNFRQGYRWSLSFDALQRHVWAFWNREDRDTESRLHHMAHAAWHCLVLLFFSLTDKGRDDRPE